MKFAVAAFVAALAGQAAAWGNVTYTTEVVTAYTTYCPEPTTLTHGDKTYTVTKATTLTISDCPCTISRPVTTATVTKCHTCPGFTNATSVAPTTPKTTASGTGAVHPTAIPSKLPTAGAGKVAALSGAGLAGLVAIVAAAL